MWYIYICHFYIYILIIIKKSCSISFDVNSAAHIGCSPVFLRKPWARTENLLVCKMCQTFCIGDEASNKTHQCLYQNMDPRTAVSDPPLSLCNQQQSWFTRCFVWSLNLKTRREGDRIQGIMCVEGDPRTLLQLCGRGKKGGKETLGEICEAHGPYCLALWD